MTITEQRTIAMLARGYTNRQIGNQLGRSLSQIGHDVERLLTSTGTRSRTELVAYAYTHGILDAGSWPALPASEARRG